MNRNNPTVIWERISRRSSDECWPYEGGTFGGRYGRFSYMGKSHLAHRVVYDLTHGDLPALIMHTCNNKLCCNPKHLVPGTNSKNQRHASSSGAFPVGATGLRGISRDKGRNYWTAQGYLGGKKYTLYCGPNLAKACAARAKWEEKHGVTFFTQGENL